jgi:hypothetical protein
MQCERDRQFPKLSRPNACSMQREMFSRKPIIKSEAFSLWYSFTSYVLEDADVGSACSDSLHGWSGDHFWLDVYRPFHGSWKVLRYSSSGRRTCCNRYVDICEMCFGLMRSRFKYSVRNELSVCSVELPRAEVPWGRGYRRFSKRWFQQLLTTWHG